jgi:hypothetical protein
MMLLSIPRPVDNAGKEGLEELEKAAPIELMQSSKLLLHECQIYHSLEGTPK